MKRLVFFCLLCACESRPPNALFDSRALKGETDFFSLPFPNDVHRDPEPMGERHIDLSNFPTQGLPLVQAYREAIEHTDGFGLNSATYFRLNGDLEEKNIPDPSETIGPSTPPVSIVDLSLDPNAPERFIPAKVTFHSEGNAFIQAHWLSVLPYPGFPLKPKHTYAVILRNSLGIASSLAFQEMLSDVPPTDTVKTRLYLAYAPLREQLQSLEKQTIAVATVFTTRSLPNIYTGIRDAVDAIPLPQLDQVTLNMEDANLIEFTATYSAPNFQSGMSPYDAPNTGQLVFDALGRPIVMKQELMRLSVSIPKHSRAPQHGWPLVLYAHGSGGDYQSYLRSGLAERYTKLGFAVASIDQVLHGARHPNGAENDDNAEILFFNYSNPNALLCNVQQGAADLFTLQRVLKHASLIFQPSPTGPKEILTFDSEHFFFVGHSQGALTGAAYVANASNLKGSVLSGGGGVFYLSVAEKREPFPILPLLATFLSETSITEDHPVLHLLQWWGEPSDAVNSGEMFMLNRAHGPAFITEGIGDALTPNSTTEALAHAWGAPLVDPALQIPLAYTLATQIHPEREMFLPRPILRTPSQSQVILGQYMPQADDGHYVFFDIPEAKQDTNHFLTAIRDNGAVLLP